MKICVVGTGYVGLVIGAGFADMGNDVVCCDVDADKIAMLKRKELPIYEPGLDKLCFYNVSEGRLTFTESIPDAVAGAEVVFLAVGTPTDSSGAADLSHLLTAAEQVVANLTGWAALVVKSTVPVGTGDRIEAMVRKVAKHEVSVASNPEFLKEGDAINDFLKPDRVIIGSSDRRTIRTLTALYAPFIRVHDNILVMDRRSAELTKYAANSMLATRISFMNELANLCDAVGADIDLIRKGMGSDPRIGTKFLYAGVGFGGSCFPKDLRAAVTTGRDAGVRLELLESVLGVNERQKRRLGERVLSHFGKDLRGKRIAVWGLAFKPGTDDIREAPALVLIEQMLSAGADVVATDPVAVPVARKRFKDRVRFETSPLAAARDADALALMTEWREYRQPNFERLKEAMRTPVLFDGRNQWEPDAVRAAGFTYYAIGRAAPTTDILGSLI